MKRRDFMALFAGAMWVRSSVGRAQNAMPQIGFLHGESPARLGSFLDLVREGLGEAGFVEGKNVGIGYRWADGDNEKLDALAADLVRRHVAAIVAPGSTPAALAAKRATATIPIVVFTAGDPVALGLVKSLARPGGNVTGATSLGRELAPKRLELLRELMPQAKTMGLLVNPTNPALADSTAKAAQDAAGVLSLQLLVVSAGTDEDLKPAFAQLARVRAGGLVIAVDSFFTARRKAIAELALRYKVPAIYQYADFAASGGIMSYGGTPDGYRIAGLYAGRILKGEKPADLPMQEITKTELVVSLRSARALGIEVPPLLLARADQVIE